MKIKSPLQLRLNEIQATAIETFGSKTKADTWLNRKNIALGATPISLAKSDEGLLQVRRVLSAISYGGVV
ncbi:MbcA/ParS/Xre antitoxin family protein [Pararhizobium sp.]|uniref:MbcA/ParS/Xre antitoxin family protein n=1 Tax=Pararhizobium sp. TaxID=1977563 RepID=UPI0027261DEF|nr:MbcA/ParS/Xre antitoxin family protein [Pararhizobium sp.]MDO9417414.1 MbcA/ParS/Xre antitoxin family protein [Pararhizobium sp.]MDP2248399.1 MbcA/ParS/Xre antitoxin family protein [Nitrosomonadales bacterium]